jgi:hypothetical protein
MYRLSVNTEENPMTRSPLLRPLTAPLTYALPLMLCAAMSIPEARGQVITGTEVSHADFGVTRSLSHLLAEGPEPKGNALGVDRRISPLGRPPVAPSPSLGADPALQKTAPVTLAGIGAGFNGIGDGLNGFSVQYIPPDTTGAAGATQYMQAVNDKVAVFSKSSGALLAGPFNMSTLFASALGTTHPCASFDDGDPIVQYDKAARRWLLSQFAVTQGTPYYECVAVSQTEDATGAYYAYAFSYPNFPDYPKIGVWPDGYYATFNMFNGNAFKGAKVCVYERAKMLIGASARQVCSADLASYSSLLPGDLDGLSADLNNTATVSSCGGAACPAIGDPNFLANISGGFLQLGWVTVNWGATPVAKILLPRSLSPEGAKIFSLACGGSACIAQPIKNARLDSLGDRLMFRLAWRRIKAPGGSTYGTQGRLIASHAVQAGTTKNSYTGIRWYEILPTADVAANKVFATIRQQSSFAPDTNYRWMGSAGMDNFGDIAVGYSISNANLNPSIDIATRSQADALNTLTSQVRIKAGSGGQTQSRWGDYTHMSADPVNSCQLWFTGQYQPANGAWNWRTWIAPVCFHAADSTCTCN